MRSQLKRATERYGSLDSRNFFHALSQPLENECSNTNHEVKAKADHVPDAIDAECCDADQMMNKLERRFSSVSSEVCPSDDVDAEGQENSPIKSIEEIKKPDALIIPADFLCPISLELMRDPVIVATGQVCIIISHVILHF